MTVRQIKDAARVQPNWLNVYLISDRSLLPEDRLLECFESALKAGVRDLQLREKDLPLDKLFPLALELRRMTARYGARLYINARLDVALMVDADGVHLPEGGLPAGEVKARYPHLLVGVSTHSLDGAQRAEQNGADFVTFSPIYDTPSKRSYGAPQGLDKLRQVAENLKIPVLALGGIQHDRVSEVLEAGAHGVALISGIWKRPDISEAVREFTQYFPDFLGGTSQ